MLTSRCQNCHHPIALHDQTKGNCRRWYCFCPDFRTKIQGRSGTLGHIIRWPRLRLPVIGIMMLIGSALFLMAFLSIKINPDYYNQLNISENDMIWFLQAGAILGVAGGITFGINWLFYREFFPPRDY